MVIIEKRIAKRCFLHIFLPVDYFLHILQIDFLLPSKMAY